MSMCAGLLPLAAAAMEGDAAVTALLEPTVNLAVLENRHMSSSQAHVSQTL